MKFDFKTPLPDHVELLRVASSQDAIRSVAKLLRMEDTIENGARKLTNLLKKDQGRGAFVCDVGHHQYMIAGFLIACVQGRYYPRLLIFKCTEEHITPAVLETVLNLTEEYAAKLIAAKGGGETFLGGPLSTT